MYEHISSELMLTITCAMYCWGVLQHGLLGKENIFIIPLMVMWAYSCSRMAELMPIFLMGLMPLYAVMWATLSNYIPLFNEPLPDGKDIMIGRDWPVKKTRKRTLADI